MNALYFNKENYTGNHLHVDNWKNEFTPVIEAIAWERQDGSMDLFFNDSDNGKLQDLYAGKEFYYDDEIGLFLGNVKSNEEANETFRKWVDTVLNPYRNKTM
ncbi:hypothetical protein SAMN05444673_4419 [Bacillus sp. OV166]|uniref:hypothetical protein n=1 Tax=Bacillus sp. OV166 TaxID=1882763 RepID=UPI000A2ABB43|nr:hypothetical protein [Bacillus sp. OV166]SMQ81631.1 hypothetical protein SAMN05444673_4419 [Bacillus sp. OV166]